MSPILFLLIAGAAPITATSRAVIINYVALTDILRKAAPPTHLVYLFHLRRGSRWCRASRCRPSSGRENRDRSRSDLLTRVHTLVTSLHGAERIQLYQVGGDNTLSTSDVAARVDALRKLGSLPL